MKSYGVEERAHYVAPSCPHCEGADIGVVWVDVTADRWMPQLSCSTCGHQGPRIASHREEVERRRTAQIDNGPRCRVCNGSGRDGRYETIEADGTRHGTYAACLRCGGSGDEYDARVSLVSNVRCDRGHTHRDVHLTIDHQRKLWRGDPVACDSVPRREMTDPDRAALKVARWAEGAIGSYDRRFLAPVLRDQGVTLARVGAIVGCSAEHVRRIARPLDQVVADMPFRRVAALKAVLDGIEAL